MRAAVLALTAALALPACALLKSPVTKAVVDLAFAECVQAAESSDAATVAALCGAGPELYAILERLLAAKRAGMARAGVCKPAPVSVRTPMLYNSALQICMNDIGYHTNLAGVTQ